MSLLQLFENIVCYRIDSAEDVVLEIRSIMSDYAGIEYRGVVGTYHWFKTKYPYSSVLTNRSELKLKQKFPAIHLKFDSNDHDILNFYIPVGFR